MNGHHTDSSFDVSIWRTAGRQRRQAERWL